MNTQIPLEVGIAIGRILSTRESKLYIRAKNINLVRSAESRLAQAKSSYSAFGMYDDCGPSYEADLIEAKENVRNAQSARALIISFEKHLKKQRCEFKEKYPEWVPLLEQELNRQTEQIQAKNKSLNYQI